MSRWAWVFGAVVTQSLAFGATAQENPGWGSVAPIFESRCTACHSGDGGAAGLRLDSYANAMAGSADGPVLIAGDPDSSELVQRIRGESRPMMPLVGEPLSEDEIAAIVAWIEAGLDEGAVTQEPIVAAPEPVLPAPGEAVNFADVEPILLQRCAGCHIDAGQPGGPPEGLSLDTLANVLDGGERVVVIPGNADLSELIRRIEGTSEPAMPFGGPPLPDEQMALLRAWIEQGAADAAGAASPVPVGGEVRYRGWLTAFWAIDGAAFTIGDARIDDSPTVGGAAEVRGVVQEDGTVLATRVRGR